MYARRVGVPAYDPAIGDTATRGRGEGPRVATRLAAALAGTVVALAAWLAPAPPAAAQDAATVGLQVFPSAVELGVGASADGVVVVTNPCPAITALDLFAVAADGAVEVELGDAPAALARGASTDVGFTVTRVGAGTGAATSVTIGARWQFGAGGCGDTPGARPGSAVATVTVTYAAEAALLELSWAPAAVTVDENDRGEVTLVVANTRPVPVTVDALEVTAPEFVDAEVRVPGRDARQVDAGATVDVVAGEPLELGPRRRQAVTVELSAGDRVLPGEATVVVRAVAAEGAGGVPFEALTTLPVTLEVYGESGILEAVGAPIFLLLPGLVFVPLALWATTRLTPAGVRLPSTATEDVTFAKVSLLVVASIAFSLAFAYAYPTLTGWWPGTERDFRRAYGFVDFVYVFVWAFLLVLAVWLVLCLVAAIAGAVRWCVVPTPADHQVALLRKLALRSFGRLPAARQLVRQVADGALVGVHLADRSGRRVLVGPPVLVRLPQGRTASGALAAPSTASVWTLWREVRKLRKEPGVTVTWAAGLGRPALVAAGTVALDANQQRSLVEVE